MTNKFLPTCYECNICPDKATCVLRDIVFFDATSCDICSKSKMESLK